MNEPSFCVWDEKIPFCVWCKVKPVSWNLITSRYTDFCNEIQYSKILIASELEEDSCFKQYLAALICGDKRAVAIYNGG